MYLFQKILLASIFLWLLTLSGCGSKTIELQKQTQNSQKSIFEHLKVDEIHLLFYQEGKNLNYLEVQKKPFESAKIKELYKRNEKALESENENAKLYDCITIQKNGKTRQCEKEYNYSLFAKRVAKIVQSPINAVDVVLLPLTLVIDTMGQTTENTKRALTSVEIDEDALKKYGKYLISKLSYDYEVASKDFNSYKSFIEDTKLIQFANPAITEQLRSFDKAEAYAIAYDISQDIEDLAKAYPSLSYTKNYLESPSQIELITPNSGNCLRVKPSSLNIRSRPSPSAYRVGVYKKDDIVCVKEQKNGWVKDSKGWVSAKYLTDSKKTNAANLALKTKRVRALHREYEKNQALSQNSLAAYKEYSKKYGTSSEIDKKMQKIHRAKGEKNADAQEFVSSYKLGANAEDIKSYLKYIKTDALKRELDEPTFVNSDHTRLLKSELIDRLRTTSTKESFVEAFNYSNAPEDILSALALTQSIDELEKLLVMAQKETLAAQRVRNKLVPLYREQNSFAGSLRSYELLAQNSDAKKALSLASSDAEFSRVEALVFKNIQHPEALLDVSLKAIDARYDDKEISRAGVFSKHSFSGYAYPTAKLTVGLTSEDIFHPAFGSYKAVIELEASLERNYQLRSGWLGNSDKSEFVRERTTVEVFLNPPYGEMTKFVKLRGLNFVYFDRGSQGGYTAKWPRDDIVLRIKSLKLVYVDQTTGKRGDLDIDFDALADLKPQRSYKQSYISGSYDKGLSLIQKFGNLDSAKNSRYRSYESRNSSYTTSTPSSSSAKTSQKSKNSSSAKTGYKRVYDGGYKSAKGYTIYRVECQNGATYSAFQASDGYWYDGGGANYGDRYRNLSKDSFAQKRCDY